MFRKLLRRERFRSPETPLALVGPRPFTGIWVVKSAVSKSTMLRSVASSEPPSPRRGGASRPAPGDQSGSRHPHDHGIDFRSSRGAGGGTRKSPLRSCRRDRPRGESNSAFGGIAPDSGMSPCFRAGCRRRAAFRASNVRAGFVAPSTREDGVEAQDLSKRLRTFAGSRRSVYSNGNRFPLEDDVSLDEHAFCRRRAVRTCTMIRLLREPRTYARASRGPAASTPSSAPSMAPRIRRGRFRRSKSARRLQPCPEQGLIRIPGADSFRMPNSTSSRWTIPTATI